MAAPIDLRNDFDSVSLRRLAKRTRDATQSRRLLALAEVYDGGSRTDASRIGGVGLQIIRDWVLRFNARGPDGLVDGKSPGAPSKLNADHRRALAEVVEAGPVPAVDGVVRWRRKDLARWLLETFAISLDETTVGRELKALGFAKISARPRHYAQNELAVEAFKKNFPAELAKIRARLPKGVEIELWWQDEARIGQKNKLTRRWARRGTRPRAPRDQRTEWAYIFGAICPAKGKGAGLVMPWCDTDAMAAHLIEISTKPPTDPGAHAVLIVQQCRLALDAQAGDPRQHHRPGAAATIARVEPGGECLAIHARQLVVEPDLQILRRHRRAVLPSLEQPHRPTMEDHVPRHAQMGAWVLINDRWYYLDALALIERLHRLLLDVIKDEFERVGILEINAVQALLLFNIGENEVTAGELKSRGYYQGSNVSYNLKKLVEAGYMHHQRCEVDRRSVRVRLTEKGRKIRDAVGELFNRHADGLISRNVLSAEAVEDINSSLKRVERYWSDQIRYIY